jgi:hypothetical protein
LGALVAFPSAAWAAEVRGRVILHGPARSSSALRVTLRYVGALPNVGSQEAQRTRRAADGSFAFDFAGQGETTNLALDDQTVEIQNLSATVGLEISHR